MRTTILLTWIVLCCTVRSVAMCTADGTGGSTNKPAGLKKPLVVNGTCYTIITENDAIGTKHTAKNIAIGAEARLEDKVYTVASVTLHPNLDEAIVTITGTFPAGSSTEILPTNQIVAGVGIVMTGIGMVNGEDVFREELITVPPAMSLSVTGISRRESATELAIAGFATNGAFMVEKTTNLSSVWTTLPTVHTATGQVAQVSLPPNNDPSMYYRIRPVSSIITNKLQIGSKLKYSDGQRRYATNTIHDVRSGHFISTYDRNAGGGEGSIAYGDSSDGCFIQDTNDGKLKLAGINFNAPDIGPWSADRGQTWFEGPLFDYGGLTPGEFNPETQQYKPGDPVDTNQVYPSISGYVLIDVPWAMGVCNASNQNQ